MSPTGTAIFTALDCETTHAIERLNMTIIASVFQRRLMVSCLGCLCALLFCGAEPFKTIRLQEGVNGYTGTQDVTLCAGQGGSPDHNHGAEEFLSVWEREKSLNNFRRCLIKFDLRSIQPGTRISAASLTLFARRRSFGEQGVTTSLYLLDQENKGWRQGTGVNGNLADAATWSFRDRSSRKRWAGGPGLLPHIDYHASPVASAQTPDAADADPESGGVPMDLVLNPLGIRALQNWIDHPSTNVGFLIRQPDDSQSVDKFWSSEAASAAVRPVLTLTIAPGRSSSTRWIIGKGRPVLPRSIADLSSAVAGPSHIDSNFVPYLLETQQ